ncbi:MAG: hypothetical protein KAG66_24405, partial [Methylococcales bacterium]|nr:hypothetical protein [Methylococcales bacterium]
SEPLVPTGQTPPTDIDPADVSTTNSPAIELKKYVMPAPDATATAIVEGSEATYGADAQDNASAQNIVFGESATYRIRVMNTGTTWLANVVVDDVIEDCKPLVKVAGAIGDSDATTPDNQDGNPDTLDGVMSIGEVWWLECTLPAIQTDINNIATVSGRPIHTPTDPADPTTYEPTGQSPVNDTDPANVTTNSTSAITLKKYVQPEAGAPAIANAFSSTPDVTWGEDAQGSASAVNIPYGTAALFRIRVQNTGGTWLDNVDVQDHICGVGQLTVVEFAGGSAAAGSSATAGALPEGMMAPNDILWFECTLPEVNAPLTNIATVRADPIETPTNGTDPFVKLPGFPVTADDPASVDTTADPRIELKKYVQPALGAPAWNGAIASLGDDA